MTSRTGRQPRVAPQAPPRTIAVWCPDWAVHAAASTVPVPVSEDRPVAVLAANRIVATNVAARRAGVRRGLRKRDAEYRCPGVLLLPRDPLAEARRFEPIVAALETVAAGVEVTRPGLVAMNADNVSRYHQGEEAALAAVIHAVRAAAPVDVMTGIADGAFTAALAARDGDVVPRGESPKFLAPLPITIFGDAPSAPMVDLLLRLGVRTLGDFAGLPTRDVATRFGPDGAWAHRLASGLDDRPLAARRPPADCAVRATFDDPVGRADAVAFGMRTAAEQFITGLADRGLSCACAEILINFDDGQQATRRWRHAGLLTSVAIVDRIRWQLEGWFAADPAGRSAQWSGAVTAVTIAPVETACLGAQQMSLWGGVGQRDEQAELGLARVQSRYGYGSVTRLVQQGGTGPSERTGRAVWGEPAEARMPRESPWPGMLPDPMPTVVFDDERPIEVLDERGRLVRFTDRAAASAVPAVLGIAGRRPVPITQWAGPWPDSEQWWEAGSALHTHRLRCQLVDVTGRAYLVTCQAGVADPGWLLEGVYD